VDDDARSRSSVMAAGRAGDDGADRRRAFRRKLPLGRGAVLLVGDRAHIVGVADVSVTGAYLTTRAPVAAGETHVLKLLVMPARVELVLRVEVVRVSLAAHESTAHPRGVAVHFVDVDEATRRHLDAFVTRARGIPH
jgi:PilZ domain